MIPEGILVIIDMQPTFEASADEQVQAEINKQIDLAKENGWPIVLVEYSGEPLTIPEIRLKRTECMTVLKDHDDGSIEILTKLNMAMGWEWHHIKKFRLCGVNTDACVLDTAEGLAKILPEYTIEIYYPACNTVSRAFDPKGEPDRFKNLVWVEAA